MPTYKIEFKDLGITSYKTFHIYKEALEWAKERSENFTMYLEVYSTYTVVTDNSAQLRNAYESPKIDNGDWYAI